MTESVDAFGKPATPEPPRPPRPLLIARWLWIGSALVIALRSFVDFIDRGALNDRLRQASPQLTQQQIDDVVNEGILMAIMIAALTIGYAVVLSNRMVSGRNWARILLAGLGGFNAFGTVLLLCMVAVLGTALIAKLSRVVLEPSDLIVSSVVMLMNIAALVLMFHRDANRFFREIRSLPAGTGTSASSSSQG